jgi:hypothetical protein
MMRSEFGNMRAAGAMTAFTPNGSFRKGFLRNGPAGMAVQAGLLDFAAQKKGVFRFKSGRHVPLLPICVVGNRSLEKHLAVAVHVSARMSARTDVILQPSRSCNGGLSCCLGSLVVAQQKALGICLQTVLRS